jgi:hypothetical protein
MCAEMHPLCHNAPQAITQQNPETQNSVYVKFRQSCLCGVNMPCLWPKALWLPVIAPAILAHGVGEEGHVGCNYSHS